MDHEPEETERLFAYGTLQTESVQLSTFARKLNGSPDALPGYRLQMIEHHRNLEFTRNSSDFVDGTVFSVTEQELQQSDAYEPDGYKRIQVKLRSGTEAWVYLNQLTSNTQPDEVSQRITS